MALSRLNSHHIIWCIFCHRLVACNASSAFSKSY
jgi:hypothetical protein